MTTVHFIVGLIFSVLSSGFVLIGAGQKTVFTPIFFGLAVFFGLVAIRHYLQEAAIIIEEALEKQ